ncbi:MAG: hypothetical protein ACLFVJ_19105, partial [Persicimonas sp.]
RTRCLVEPPFPYGGTKNPALEPVAHAEHHCPDSQDSCNWFKLSVELEMSCPHPLAPDTQ